MTIQQLLDNISAFFVSMDTINYTHRTCPTDPHCNVLCGRECPPDCLNHGRMFDGCHICDCIHGGKDEGKNGGSK